MKTPASIVISISNPLYLKARVMAEVYPTTFLEDDPEDVQGRLRPYGLIGLGVFHFNPQGSLSDGRGNTYWYDLRPLHTEGEGWVAGSKEYSLTQLNIPMGFGVKYFLSEDVNISAEIGLPEAVHGLPG